MRVRPLRSKPDSARRARRPHRVATPAAEPAAAIDEPAAELEAERRLRASGGPDDRASYTCSCGLVFEASVSTGVSCPHCGADQAW